MGLFTKSSQSFWSFLVAVLRGLFSYPKTKTEKPGCLSLISGDLEKVFNPSSFFGQNRSWSFWKWKVHATGMRYKWSLTVSPRAFSRPLQLFHGFSWLTARYRFYWLLDEVLLAAWRNLAAEEMIMIRYLLLKDWSSVIICFWKFMQPVIMQIEFIFSLGAKDQ